VVTNQLALAEGEGESERIQMTGYKLLNSALWFRFHERSLGIRDFPLAVSVVLKSTSRLPAFTNSPQV
jgi:hypothetical protein